MRNWLISGAFGLLACAGLVHADQQGFVGELILQPAGCESSGQCTLKVEFSYVDPQRIGWTARAGLTTDGASIPGWAQPIVGKPFTPAYVKAAVIHDHYCDRRVRPWRQTHRVFYDALRQSGVPAATAGTMYFAVLVGGPKWVKLVPGKPCPVGLACINRVDGFASVPGTGLAINEKSELLAARNDLYETATFQTALRENAAVIDTLGETMTPEQVELLAAEAMANDFFFQNPDEVGSSLSIEVNVR